MLFLGLSRVIYILYTDKYNGTLRLLNDIRSHFYPSSYKLVRLGWLSYVSNVMVQKDIVQPIEGIMYVLALYSQEEPALIQSLRSVITDKTRVAISRNGKQWWTRSKGSSSKWWAHHNAIVEDPPVSSIRSRIVFFNER